MDSTAHKTPKEIVKDFILSVRSGKFPHRANEFMAHTVFAHQIQSENEVTITRTPEDYEEHIREFLQAFGNFELEIQDIFGHGDRVYVRWKQSGYHIMSQSGEEPTGKPLIEMTSAVYRIENEKIVEYWLQFDRMGMEAQIRELARSDVGICG